jgi:hypothetical protein
VTSLETPKYLSPLRLHDPEMRLKISDNDDNPLNLMPEGEVPIGYIDVVLDSTHGSDGQPYIGPHLIGFVDTAMFTIKFIRDGYYNFLTPLKIVEVSELHIPHELN